MEEVPVDLGRTTEEVVAVGVRLLAGVVAVVLAVATFAATGVLAGVFDLVAGSVARVELIYYLALTKFCLIIVSFRDQICHIMRLDKTLS